jgi:hypothetical protein
MTLEPSVPASSEPGADSPRHAFGMTHRRENAAPIVRRPWDRIAAWLVDWGCSLTWVAAAAAVGVPLYLTGVTHVVGPVALNVVGAVVVVVPVTLGLAWLESRRREATVGKRVRRLVVVTAAGRSRIGFGRALLRNVAKVMVPWLVGHAAVYSIVGASAEGAVPIGVWVLTTLAYALPVVYVASLFIGTGRTPYDRIAGTAVLRGASS